MTVRRTHLVLALAALAAAGLYNVWYFVIRPGGRTAEAGPRPALERPLAPVAAGGAAARDPLSIPAPPPIDAASRPAWGRDPFLFGDESRSEPRPAAVAAPEPARPFVSTILYSSSRRLAIVNGRTVGVGDAAGAYTVADIERTAVVFTAPNGDRVRVSLHAAELPPVAR